MKKLLAFLVVALSPVTLHAQGVWTQENIDPDTGLRTGVIQVNGSNYTIEPSANLSGADLSGANLRDADLRTANFSGANLSRADLSTPDPFPYRVNLSGADLLFANLTEIDPGAVIAGASKGNYDEIQVLNPKVEANTAKVGITAEQAASIESNTTEIDDLKVMMEAVSVQMQQLNTQLGDLQASVAEKDTQIAGLKAERDAAVQERNSRHTEEQIRALSPDYTMGLNEAGNVEVKISFIASSDATNFAPFSVTADSLTVVDGKICMELPPDQGAFFYKFRIE